MMNEREALNTRCKVAAKLGKFREFGMRDDLRRTFLENREKISCNSSLSFDEFIFLKGFTCKSDEASIALKTALLLGNLGDPNPLVATFLITYFQKICCALECTTFCRAGTKEGEYYYLILEALRNTNSTKADDFLETLTEEQHRLLSSFREDVDP